MASRLRRRIGTYFSAAGSVAGTTGGGAVGSAVTSGGIDAGAIYVSTSGNDSTGDGTVGNPYRTPVYAVARLTAGQTCYIRAGTYDVATPTTNRSCAIVPPANNCKIAAYPGETVILRGGRSGANYGVFPTGGVIGAANGRSGTTISGLTVRGMVMVDGNAAGTQRTRIENCDISVGGDGWSGTNQGGVVWLNDAVSADFVNCVLYGNAVGSESGTPQNNGLVMSYVSTGCTFENCTFRNSVGTGITMKDDTDGAVIRYCWFDSNAYSGLWTGNNTANTYSLSISVYQNLFTNNNTAADTEHGAISFLIETSQVNVYNNTFYRNYVADVTEWAGDVPWAFFNNICSTSRAYYLAWPYGASPFTANYLDYNCYNGGASGWNYRGSVSGNLAAWQSAVNALLAGADSHSVATSPGFLNGSGAYTAAADFKRSSYPTDGRGGSWPSVMGCYITGTETIGSTL